MREKGDGIVVAYSEFVARRHRRLRIMADLRSQASAHTIDGEVLQVHSVKAQAEQSESPAEAVRIDGCGTQQHKE
jgi:hypothetical protein